MKNLKITLPLIFLFLVFSTISVAQNIENDEKESKKTRLILKLAPNISSVYIDAGDNSGAEKSKIGYNVAVVADIPLNEKFHLQTGVGISAKGSKLREMQVGYGLEEFSMNAVYAQVPLLFLYKIDIMNYNNSFNMGIGPYFAYGIFGETKNDKNSTTLVRIDTFGENGYCNRPDVGLNMELQFETPHLLLFMGYEYGFTKMIRTSILEQEYQNSVSIHNVNYYIGLGLKF